MDFTGRTLAYSSNSCRSATLTRSEEHTSELQSQSNLVCRLLLEKKKKNHVFQALDALRQFLAVLHRPACLSLARLYRATTLCTGHSPLLHPAAAASTLVDLDIRS